jgi:site-specific DNA recombinase
MSEIKRRVRCAVYTRKSTEEGLDMEFNSLDAQREAGEAYVLSQRHEGWTLVSDYYDDGGFSGGSMERPALKRLMRDVEAGAVDVIVVYKVDRLSRSLMDFAKLVEVFDRHNVSFVSVTQQFNTTTSMGRLTLNILLSFAQFEREVIGERIRDKLAASKRKGMWMGGTPPLGYDVVARKLIINEAEAKQVRHIFERFITLRSATLLMKELRTSGIRTKSYVTQTGNQKTGRFFSKNQIYRTLHNRLYLGEMPHKDKSYPGQHEAIIALDLWNEAHAVMQVSPRMRGRNTATKTPALLKGIVRCGGCASAMSPTHCLKKGKHYRYYKPSQLLKGGCETCPVGSIPAGELEEVVVNQLRQVFVHPEMIVRTWAAANAQDSSITEQEVKKALNDIGPVWNELFPAEQSRIVNLLIENVTVDADGVDIKMRANGLESLTRDVFSYQKRLENA